jgi:hypothetical protein
MSSITQRASLRPRPRDAYTSAALEQRIRPRSALVCFLSSFLSAMHESRRDQAEREIQWHQYLIHQAKAYDARREAARRRQPTSQPEPVLLAARPAPESP